jgi:hypothetical protein
MNTFNFYLMTFFLKYFPGNIFENSAFFAVADIIAFALVGFVLKSTNIKNALNFAFVIDIIGGILYLCFSTNTAIVPYLISLMRGGVTMTFNIGYVSVKELFPTQYVATVYGQVNLVAHIFACTSPLIAEVKNPWPFVAYLIAVGVAMAATTQLEEIKDSDIDLIEFSHSKEDLISEALLKDKNK